MEARDFHGTPVEAAHERRARRVDQP